MFPNYEVNLSVPEMRTKLRTLIEGIRVLRNRIAHHEPIIARDLELDFKNIDLLINYRCTDTAHWTYKNQLVTPLLELKPF